MLLKPTKFYKALPNSSEVSPKGNLLFAGFAPLNPTKSALCLRRSNLTGFTLIELLVVIVIITILASVLLITFKGVDERAKLSNLIQFSQSQRTAFFNDLVGWWTLDDIIIEGATSTIIDNSLQRNNGIVYGGVVIAKGMINGALKFDGVDDYVDLNAFAISGTSAGTFEAWIYKTGNGQIIDNRQFYIGVSGSNLLLDIYTTGGWAQGAGGFTLSLGLPSSQWYYLAVVKQSGITADVYINGVYRTSITTKAGNLSYIETPHTIGRYFNGIGGGGLYFKGLIDEVQIYNVALPLAVIQQHYAQGLERHQNLAQR